jgi:teichoic acid transport system permease protein
MPYLLVVTGFCGFGLAMLFAVANVYVRDISRLLPHALRLWLYLSPAIWVYTTVLSDTTLDTLARVNPLYSGMAAWTIAFGGNLDANGPGIFSLLVTFTLWALAIGIIGFLIFVSREDDFAIRN